MADYLFRLLLPDRAFRNWRPWRDAIQAHVWAHALLIQEEADRWRT